MLKDRIAKDLNQAVKSQDRPRIKALRFLSAQIKNKEIALRPDPLKDEHIVGVLQKQIKQSREALESFKTAGYKAQSEEESFQIAVIESYLPKALAEDELKALVKEAVEETQAQSVKDMGAVMKSALAKAEGRADGKALSQAVRAVLTKI